MNIYAFIIPIVLLLLVAEIIVCLRTRNGYYSFQDTITNIGTGIGNQCINLGVAFFVYHFYGWLYSHAPYHFEAVWYNYILLLVLQDFVFYWFHRTGHSINIFWAAHMPHHSSEEMNLSVGIRASFTQRIFQFLFFDWILALAGFSPDMIYGTAAVHLLIAYWHHTRLISRLGPIEKLFVTPSHHRVHHGVNTQYLDKNFSEFLIIWDKLFGTYEPEVEEVCYGVTHPPRTWDPIYINFQYWKQLWDDAVAAPYWSDKVRIWVMPLGWRPRGLPPFAQQGIGYTRAEQVKYSSRQFKTAYKYLVLQIIMGLVYMYFCVNQNTPLANWERLGMIAGLFMMIVSWGGILEARRWAILLEIFRLLYMGTTLIWFLHNAFGISWVAWPSIVALLLVGISVLWVSFYFRTELTEGQNFVASPQNT